MTHVRRIEDFGHRKSRRVVVGADPNFREDSVRRDGRRFTASQPLPDIY